MQKALFSLEGEYVKYTISVFIALLLSISLVYAETSIALEPQYPSHANVDVLIQDLHIGSKGRVTVIQGFLLRDNTSLSDTATVTVSCNHREKAIVNKTSEVRDGFFNVYFVQLFSDQTCMAADTVRISVLYKNQTYVSQSHIVPSLDKGVSGSSALPQAVQEAVGVPEFNAFGLILGVLLAGLGVMGIRRHFH